MYALILRTSFYAKVFEILNVDMSLHLPKMHPLTAQDVKMGAVIVVALVGVVCPDFPF